MTDALRRVLDALEDLAGALDADDDDAGARAARVARAAVLCRTGDLAGALAAMPADDEGGVRRLADALGEMGDVAALPALEARATPAERDAVRAALAAAVARGGDQAAARELALGIAANELRATTLMDLIEHAARDGRIDDVGAVASSLAEAGYPHLSAAALATVGDHAAALAFADRSPEGWCQAHALAAVAGAAGARGDREAFEALAARAFGAIDDPTLWWESHARLVDGARAALGDDAAMPWIERAPAEHHDGLWKEIAQSFARSGDRERATAATRRIADDEEREDTSDHVAAALAARAHADAAARATGHAGAGRMAEMRAAMAEIGEPWTRFRARLDAARVVAPSLIADVVEEAIAVMPEAASVEDALATGASLGRVIATRAQAGDRGRLTQRLWARYEASEGPDAASLGALAELAVAEASAPSAR
ncbi:MAG TPA: hypothetical protein VEA38_13195 [Terriglobales bacterium]|nr:hypothetical protein [Terriglobales bacterium]